jgi:hypothetical protein
VLGAILTKAKDDGIVGRAAAAAMSEPQQRWLQTPMFYTPTSTPGEWQLTPSCASAPQTVAACSFTGSS